MFRKTRLQLTIRNAIVLSIILISLSTLLYGYMKIQIFERVDNSLNNRSSNYRVNVNTPLDNQPFALRIADFDRPVFQLLWLSNDRVFHGLPMIAELSEEELKQFSPSKFTVKPQNIKVREQYFRVLTTSVTKKVVLATHLGERSGTINSIQFITNVSAEVNMLHRLQLVLLIGGGLGMIIAMIAGLYLAKRALIPIRTSWERQQLFVSDASHELRTPLTVIQTYTELLLRHPNQTIEQESRHISNILKETKRMSKLVNDLLTLARTDSNETQITVKPALLDLILKDVVDHMKYLAETKEIVIQTEIDDSVQINVDEERIHQLFFILIDNALKYTQEHGFVRISMRKNAQSATVEIEDTGIGISPQDLPYIFDRFYRGDKARTRADNGAGLGLSIAKWIVESHGGKIRVESKDTGSKFLIHLPL